MSTNALPSPFRMTLTKHFSATRQEVFEAWTNPNKLKMWFCPTGGDVTLAMADVRVGGGYRIDMQFGEKVYTHTGVYHEVKRPEKLVFTWTSVNTQDQETLVTIELFARGEKTELVLTHERFRTEDSAKGHEKGWLSLFARLESVWPHLRFDENHPRLPEENER